MVFCSLYWKFTLTLDPEIRKKLLKESKNPFRGIRRILWLSLFASATIGFLIMGMRFLTGEIVLMNDFIIQIVAVLIFGSLVIFGGSDNSDN